jgi:DNA-binding transcriptional LysR family regulator
MNYTLNQLRIFVKVAELKSVTRAAEELHLTQPAVSSQLKNFQDQFSLPLFEVIKKRIHITGFGEEVFETGKKILADVGQMKYKMLSYTGLLSGKLTFSTVSTGKYVLPYFLSDFFNKNVSIDLEIDVSNRQAVIQNLQKNEIDFALMSLPQEGISIHKIDLLENKLYFVGKNSIIKNYELADLLEFTPLICREPGSATRMQLDQFILENKLEVKKTIQLTSNEAVKQAVIAGMGISLMPLIGIRNEIELGLMNIIPVKGLPLVTMWSLVYLKDKQLSPAMNAFIDYLNDHKSNISNLHFQE